MRRFRDNSTDRYVSFADLAANEVEGKDYRIAVRYGRSGIAVIAPHGGGIEPGTSEVVFEFAAAGHTCYSFEGIKRSGNGILHITGSQFDEPVCLLIVGKSKAVVSVHGCSGSHKCVYMGGLGEAAKRVIGRALAEAGFHVSERDGLGGRNPRNICNRCPTGEGVQLELTAGLREAMFRGLSPSGRSRRTAVFTRFTHVLKTAIG